jgi:hypothetical protein|tara:strand:- start:1841 stop:1984 length:144 start_codon:yes stop_codon:yes gene_type:complete
VTKHKAELETLAATSFREKGLEDMGDFFKHNVHLLTVSISQSPHSAD